MPRKKPWIERLLDEVHRGFEVAIGIVLGILSLLPVGFTVAAIITLLTGNFTLSDEPPGLVAVIGVVSSLISWFCLLTAWRLVTGRERPGGGLLHPWFLYAFAFLQMCIGAGRAQVYGPEHAQSYQQGAAELIAMARSRQQRRGKQSREESDRR